MMFLKKSKEFCYIFQKLVALLRSKSTLCVAKGEREGVEGEEGVSYKLQPYDHLLVHAKL